MRNYVNGRRYAAGIHGALGDVMETGRRTIRIVQTWIPEFPQAPPADAVISRRFCFPALGFGVCGVVATGGGPMAGGCNINSRDVGENPPF